MLRRPHSFLCLFWGLLRVPASKVTFSLCLCHVFPAAATGSLVEPYLDFRQFFFIQGEPADTNILLLH